MTTQLSHTSHAASRLTPALLPLIAGMLFLASCTTPSDTGKREADFTHYDEPLYEQMTDRIKAKVMAGLGEETNTHDRYFIIPYAYQNKGNNKGLLLEPVDIDKDVIGFVYAPERSAKGVYNPFYGGSAYRK